MRINIYLVKKHLDIICWIFLIFVALTALAVISDKGQAGELYTPPPPQVENDLGNRTESFEATITCYNSLPEQTDSTPFITAYNEPVREGLIANNYYPKGTKVIIEGKEYFVGDRMNKKYGKEYFDIWSSNIEFCKKWGVKKVKFIVL